MKRVLFIGTTNYDFQKSFPSHLEEKFLGLSRGIKPYVLARGRPFRKKIWQTEFYLLRSRMFYWPFAFLIGFYLCLFKKIDLIVAQSPLIEGFWGVLLKKIFKKELIIEVLGDWVAEAFLSKKRKFEKLQRKIVPILADFNLKRADKIRTVSKYFTQKLKEIIPQKQYFSFPAFPNLKFFSEEKEINFNNFILFVGRLTQIKGIKYLIHAFSKIKNEFPEFQLVIIGEGPERNNLELQTSGLGLKERIEFKGRLFPKEVREAMKDCYCLVLPSLSEGLGMVIIEAQALSKPVIGSNVQGIPNLIRDGENGFLFPPGNSEELAKRLTILLKDKNLAIRMGRKGKEFIKENFSNEKYIKNYIEMINS